ncbi:MAG: flagellar hook-length control protein FliK [Pseudomonadota bacterium]|jgi:chemotaxis protein MotD
MTRTDPLMAMLRQLAHGKAAPRGTPQTAAAKDAKGKVEDGKVRADHFREQLRVVAQGVKHEPQPDATAAEIDKAQDPEQFPRQATTRPRERSRQPAVENAAHREAGEARPSHPDWRSADTTLSSVMSKLEQAQAQAQAFAPPDDGDPSRATQAHGTGEPRMPPGDRFEAPKLAKAAVAADQGFASSLGAVETRATPAVKVVVREQETHFQPVGQPTLLQKIVDRIAPDLATTPALPAANMAEATLAQPHRGPDAPIRMLTLQLDPPNLGMVTVRMRLTGDAVEVKLSADRQDTTQLLRAERGALVDAMQSAGYTFEIASIDHSQAGHMDPGAGQPQAQSNQQQSQQPQGGAQFSSGTPERQPNDAHAGTRHNRQGHDQFTEPTERRQDEEVAPRRTGGGVYL